MKIFTKVILTTVILIIVLSFTINAQTNVSGGIYTDTIWTLTNSPYIVIDTVVVFPGVTLTIEPGVIVKFANNQQLEIRQGKLIANGTITDSISFTSNSPSPTPGIYAGVYINGGMTSELQYCNIKYAHDGMIVYSSVPGFIAKHCKIIYNYNGIAGAGAISNAILDSCDIKYNTGWAVNAFYNITNCNISNNHNGVYNGFNINNCVIDSNSEIGIYENSGSILNCFIRHDSTGIYGGNPLTLNNCVISNNHTGIELYHHQTITYCTIDSNSIGIYNNSTYGMQYNYVGNCYIEYNVTGISDRVSPGYAGGNTFTKNIIDNNATGILLATTTDSIYCNSICNNASYGLKYLLSNNTNCVANNYWCTVDSASTEAVIYDGYDNVTSGLVTFMSLDTVQCYLDLMTGIPIYEVQPMSFSIFPNPAANYIIIELSSNASQTETKIFNVLGDQMNYSISANQQMKIDISNLSNGVYILEVANKETISRQKFIKQ